MKRILVFTDFSRCAELATDTAIQLAQKHDGEIEFIHYMNRLPENWGVGTKALKKSYPDYYKEFIDSSVALSELEDLAKEYGVKAKGRIIYEFKPRQLSELIKESDSDCVIMGSHGRTSFEEFMMGSQAQEIVRHSPVPVIVLKQEIDILNSQLVFISDFEEEVIAAFESFINFSNVLAVPISLLHIKTNKLNSETEIKSRMNNFESRAGSRLKDSLIIEAKSIELGIERYCAELDNAVLSIGTHGRLGLNRIIKGSHSEKIVNRLMFPVITIPINKG